MQQVARVRLDHAAHRLSSNAEGRCAFMSPGIHMAAKRRRPHYLGVAWLSFIQVLTLILDLHMLQLRCKWPIGLSATQSYLV